MNDNSTGDGVSSYNACNCHNLADI